jgi:Fe2+ transport system protein B
MEEKGRAGDGALLNKALRERRRIPMIHTLLGIAVIVFIVWLLLVVVGHVGGFLINLLWILILVALIWWLVNFFSGRHRTL